MRQWVFLILLGIAAVAAFDRPLYSMPILFRASTDLENVTGWSSCNNIQSVSTENPCSGKYSSRMEGKYAISYVFNMSADKLPTPDVKMIRLKARVYTDADNIQLSAVAKAHVGESAPLVYQADGVETKKGKWAEIQREMEFRGSFHKPEEISAYFMLESDSGVVYVDDMEITIF